MAMLSEIQGLVKKLGAGFFMSKLIGKQGGQSIPYCNFNIAFLPPLGSWSCFLKLKGLVKQIKWLFYVKIDRGTGWPVDTLLHL